jgi:uncharacterized membrane protein
MNKNRLEAFSDGIIAIIITIMVLELKVPHNPTWQSYLEAYPIFISYALSFVFVGLYWNSHHHLFHRASKVNNKILWVNMLGLFWLSLIPFTTASRGENSFTNITVTVYAVDLILVTISHLLLLNQLGQLHGDDSEFSKSFKDHFKNYITIALNSIAAIISLMGIPKVAFALLVLTALMWFIPNHRFETNNQKGKK